MESVLNKFSSSQLIWILIRHDHFIIGTKEEMIEWIISLDIFDDLRYLGMIRDLNYQSKVAFFNDDHEYSEGCLSGIDDRKKVVEVLSHNLATDEIDILCLDPAEVWEIE